MGRIDLKAINKYYGSNHVLKDINLVIEDGEFMTLLGPSGCGKTTTLRVIAGLEKPQEGVMLMDEKEIINAKEAFYEEPGKRGLNLVFQSYALWPHMTVFENVAFGLGVEKTPKEEIKTRVMTALKRMRIEQFAERYPSELSGGQQQRVAIARAIVTEPSVLLLDEPLSNLDAKLRVEMRSEIKRLHQDLKTTIIYVTHDQTEALTMSSRISIFFEGNLEQVAPPMELYQNPISIRVAEFIGNPAINFVEGKAKRTNNGLRVESVLGIYDFASDSLTEEMPETHEFDCILGVRPELVDILTHEAIGTIPATVYSVMPAGAETTLYLQVEGQEERILAKLNGLASFAADEQVFMSIDPDKINVFAKDSGRLVKRATVDTE